MVEPTWRDPDRSHPHPKPPAYACKTWLNAEKPTAKYAGCVEKDEEFFPPSEIRCQTAMSITSTPSGPCSINMYEVDTTMGTNLV
eukprot:1455480-Pleurochrysis_carterae.AAC.1